MRVLVVRKIKLLTPILASRPSLPGELCRKFDRVPHSEGGPLRIVTYLDRWNWAFLEARDALNLDDVSVSTIIPAPYFEVKRTSTYRRNYGGSVRSSEAFENIPSGSVLEWRFTLSNHLPPHSEYNGRFTRPPSEEEFDAMLAHIGEHLGMSFWGHGYLYGRFTLHNYPIKNEPSNEPSNAPSNEPSDAPSNEPSNTQTTDLGVPRADGGEETPV